MSKKEYSTEFLNNVDEDTCILVKVLDKESNESIYSFNEGYYRRLPEYPLELVNIFVDYILEDLDLEIFSISGNQIMTHEGLFVITEKKHLDLTSHNYIKPERIKKD